MEGKRELIRYQKQKERKHILKILGAIAGFLVLFLVIDGVGG